MMYNVNFKDEKTGVETVIDTIDYVENYTIENYLDDCYGNASDDCYNELVSLKDGLFLELTDLTMLDIRKLYDNQLTDCERDFIANTDLHTAETEKFYDLDDFKVYVLECADFE